MLILYARIEMTGTEILYGLRDSRLVHVDDAASGLACSCYCVECERPLVAKKGPVLRHHFAHSADDPNCHPAPESLIHRYAKQQLATLVTLVLPGFTVNARHESNDGRVHQMSRRHHPFFQLEVVNSHVEAEVSGYDETKVVPDVLLETNMGRVALEVFFRHQVQAEKVWKYAKKLHMSAVEICLADVAVDASSASIEMALTDLSRWRWLHNQHSRYLEVQMVRLLAMSTRIFVPQPAVASPTLRMSTLPSAKLKQAANMRGKVQALIVQMATVTTAATAPSWRGVKRIGRIIGAGAPPGYEGAQRCVTPQVAGLVGRCGPSGGRRSHRPCDAVQAGAQGLCPPRSAEFATNAQAHRQQTRQQGHKAAQYQCAGQHVRQDHRVP